MRRRFIADEVNTDRAALTGEHAAHLIRVLRARIGQEFDIATADSVRRGRVVSISDSVDRIEFELGELVPSSDSRDVTLLLSVFKFDRMEWAIEKCVELGVTRIIPIISRRTEAHLAKAAEKRVERWRRLAIQASEQSRRSGAPAIDSPLKLARNLISELTGTRILLAETESQVLVRDVVDSATDSPIVLAVGPEGGWTPEELKLFSDCGWTFASLGPTILRAETAAIAALAIVSS